MRTDVNADDNDEKYYTHLIALLIPVVVAMQLAIKT